MQAVNAEQLERPLVVLWVISAVLICFALIAWVWFCFLILPLKALP